MSDWMVDRKGYAKTINVITINGIIHCLFLDDVNIEVITIEAMKKIKK